ncbi:hypothetical protein CY34DRAFT_797286 [Suillus luteus UH-Slu-Lm8-n1]|uniref:Uncharacterized protein n=1 Tax=Suillus luteus UH-Slu-Lm8-n1 TaxID=930992 RepID=A0A0D0BUZ0_9AGAM|nr:hypothetical protein CY34DRAFT_797286 [Suillus luteus UH-Slu-Lm8-n1]
MQAATSTTTRGRYIVEKDSYAHQVSESLKHNKLSKVGASRAYASALRRSQSSVLAWQVKFLMYTWPALGRMTCIIGMFR